VRPPTEPLAQLAVRQRRHPQLGHQLTAAQLGEYARVDLVGLARQRRDVADLARVRDLHLPTRAHKRVADPDRAAHHLHDRAHLGAALDHEPRQTVLVGGHRTLADDRAGVTERAPRRTPIGPIDADILHGRASLSRG
jgi:hypothetical protein